MARGAGRDVRRPPGARSAADDPVRRVARSPRRGAQRQGGRSGGAGRFGMEFFARPGQSPEEHGREAARLAIGMLHAVEAPAGPMEVVLGAGRIRHPAARGGGPRAGGRLQPQADLELHRSDRQAGGVAAVHASSTTAPSTTRAGRSTSTTRATPGQRNVLIEERHAGRLHAGPAVGEALRRQAVGQRAPPELPPRAAAAHDQHLPGARATTIPRTSSSRSSAACTPSASRAGR